MSKPLRPQNMDLRGKLIWFALGALASGIVSLASFIFLKGTVLEHPTTHYLVLTEPASDAQAEANFDPRVIAFQTGEIMRECQVRYFETNFVYLDNPPNAAMPLIPENFPALTCVISRAQAAGIEVERSIQWGEFAQPEPFEGRSS